MSFTIDLSGKTVLITGVSSGIGAGIAKKFAEAGANVAGCDLNETDEAFAKLPEDFGIISFYKKCDVTQLEALQQLVEAVIEKFGKIDILVSNAGANVFEPAEKCDELHWQQNLDINLSAHWRLSKLCKPYLEKNNGVIIMMASNHAFSTISGCFPYNVAKTALTRLVRSLAIEWCPNIRTVGIAPGFIDTPGNQKWFDSFPDAAAERQRTIDMHPVKKIGTVDEIGGWCVFLSSKYAAFANGVTYLVDGGRSALMQDD